MPDQVHVLAGIPPRTGVSSLVGYPRGKSALLVFDRHASLKHEFGNGRLWAEGHCVPAVGLNEAAIAKHVRERERADIALGRPGVKECEDPFARGPQGRWARRRFDRPATSQGAIGPEHQFRPGA